MISRLALLASLAGSLTLAGEARAADAQAVDTYLAITGTGSAPDGRLAAGELPPLDARVVALGGAPPSSTTRTTRRGDVVRVVTTVGTGPEGAAAPARFVSHLSPGQRAEVSVAGAVGTDPTVLELAYDGGLLTALSVTAQPEG
jgi:hypothetical protein